MIIIDRFEGEWAVLEWEGSTFNFPRSLLPQAAREGDVLKFSATLDSRETANRVKRIRKLEEDLFKD